jgi:hypothetical protein
MLSLRRWRASHLLWTWAVYWLALAAVTLGPLVRAAWRVTRAGAAHGTVSASVGGGLLRAVVSTAEGGGHSWTASAHVGAVTFWIAVPPLLIWALWLASRPRQPDAAPRPVQRFGRASMSPTELRGPSELPVRDRNGGGST